MAEGREATQKPEGIIAELRRVDGLVTQGRSAFEAVRSIGVADVTYGRWRSAG